MSTSISMQQAVDDMSKIINDVNPCKLYWESVKGDDSSLNSDDPWASVTIRHAGANQASLGGIGNRSFLRNGTLIIAIFSPIGNGLQSGYEIARLSATAYEGATSPNGVWFRNVRIQEIGRDGEYMQINVLADFEYYETK